MKDIKYHFLSIFVTAIVAGSFISTGQLAGTMNSLSLTLLRFFIATLTLSPFILLSPQKAKVVKSIFIKTLLMSLFFSSFFICMFEALKTTTPLNTGTIYTLVPFMTALASIIVFRQHFSLSLLFIYLLAAIGTSWVVLKGDISALYALNFNQGDYIFLLGCLSMVGFSISMKALHHGEDSLITVFCIMLGGIIWMTLALLILQLPLGWHNVSFNMAFHMLYLALFSTLLSTIIIHKVTVKLGPVKVMAYIYLSPVFVAFIMLIFEGKLILVEVYPGIVLSIICTFLLQIFSKKMDNSSSDLKTN
ncbi:membrane protein [Marinomonas sp. MED121]|uniref:DMT family transporter n=1 Tax=Marinomonas sp. MED121 TaxID=314277 RepID=UPI000068FA34|nr:DMT family transporter [Marinomonas sp. MED121]EAQ64110.1 membrane protein [Marinomonas sp. MED121]